MNEIITKEEFQMFLSKETEFDNTTIAVVSNNIFKKKTELKIKDIIIYLVGSN